MKYFSSKCLSTMVKVKGKFYSKSFSQIFYEGFFFLITAINGPPSDSKQRTLSDKESNDHL